MLTLDRVTKSYRVGTFGGSRMLAVKDVSFEFGVGEVVSLIGESGSGKTTIGRMILRLIDITSGTIKLDGEDIRAFSGREQKAYYRKVQGVFQDPFSSINPMYKVDHVFDIMHSSFFPELPQGEWLPKVEASLASVTLNPGQVLHKYPHQLSGGQLQRILVARSLLLDIKFLVADEIISMLDASTRIDVLNLLGDLKSRGLGILFITHDLSLGNYISERSVILRRGSIVEMGSTRKVFGNPVHPYTRTLVASVPQLHRTWREVEEEMAKPAGRGGCFYHEMYPQTAGKPAGDLPLLAKVEDDHFVACAELEGEVLSRTTAA